MSFETGPFGTNIGGSGNGRASFAGIPFSRGDGGPDVGVEVAKVEVTVVPTEVDDPIGVNDVAGVVPVDGLKDWPAGRSSRAVDHWPVGVVDVRNPGGNAVFGTVGGEG